MNRQIALQGAWHVHLCPCGAEWVCNKAACRHDEDCTACEDQRAEAYYESRGMTAHQPALPMVEH